MDRAGILASLCFPTVTRFCGQLFMEASDREFGFVCLQAYNDWMIEEWCGAAPGRYIPLILIPMWDPRSGGQGDGALRRQGRDGLRLLGEPGAAGPADHPRQGPLLGSRSCRPPPTSGWWSACTSARPRRAQIAPDSPFMANLAWGAIRTSGAMLSWLFSGMFTRFPGLKIALSEGEIGWIPYFLERAEQVLDKQRYWVQRGVQFMEPRGHGRGPRHPRHPGPLPRPRVRLLHRRRPRDRQHRRDRRGQRHVRDGLPALGFHLAELHQVVKNRIGHLSPEMQYKILRGNAETALSLHAGRAPVLAGV